MFVCWFLIFYPFWLFLHVRNIKLFCTSKNQNKNNSVFLCLQIFSNLGKFSEINKQFHVKSWLTLLLNSPMFQFEFFSRTNMALPTIVCVCMCVSRTLPPKNWRRVLRTKETHLRVNTYKYSTHHSVFDTPTVKSWTYWVSFSVF